MKSNRFIIQLKKKKFQYRYIKIYSIINNKQIYFYEELKNEIINLPLKFLELKKEEIDLNDLEIYGCISKNNKIFNYFKNPIQIDNSNKEMQHFINRLLYISKITDKKQKKLLKNQNRNGTITIYYLDYLFPLIEEILSNLIYKILMNSVKVIYQELPPQTQGGLIEYVIYEKMKNSKMFLNNYINKIEIINNFVPNSFFIQNYISRKTDTLLKILKSKILIK